MKTFFTSFLIFFLASYNIFSQEGWSYIQTRTSSEIVTPKIIIPLVDSSSGNVLVLIKYKKYSRLLLFDKNQKLLSDFNSNIYTVKAENFIGSSNSNSKFSLFYKNNNNSEFEMLKINFESKTLETKPIKINLKKDYLINSFEYKGSIYLLSIIKGTSILKLNEINDEGDIAEIKIDLSNESFERFNGMKTSLYYLITSNHDLSKTQSSVINYNIPSSIELTSSVNKIYFKNGIVSLTNDNIPNQINLIQINLEQKSYKYSKVPRKGFLKENLRSEFNSFILDDYLYSSYATTNKMNFAIYDLNKKSYIKEFIIDNKNAINFNNTPILKLTKKKTKEKETNKSAQFLREVANSNLGISVYKRDSLFVVTLGASKKEKSGGLAIVGGVFGGVAGAILLSIFDSYTKSTSVKMDCLFDENFKHIDGDISKNGFDKIRDFIIAQKLYNAPLQTMFKYNDEYIWGYYNNSIGVYRFFKFLE